MTAGHRSTGRSVYAWIPLLILSIAIAGCAAWAKKDDKTRGWSAQRLYSEAKNSLALGDYESAIDYYEKLEQRYPFGAYAQQAQLDVAYAYYKYQEPAAAIAACDRFIKLHPRHPNVDYAYYLKGLTNFKQGKGFITELVERYVPADDSEHDTGALRDAFVAFGELTRRFPDSVYSADAEQRMVYLRNMLARHEIHVARYYMKRKAYVAAVNRTKYVIENYQRTPAVADALVIAVEAYSELELYDLAADSLRVLRLNYPDHPDLEDVEDLLAAHGGATT